MIDLMGWTGNESNLHNENLSGILSSSALAPEPSARLTM